MVDMNQIFTKLKSLTYIIYKRKKLNSCEIYCGKQHLLTNKNTELSN